jgi:hypothetical protein
LELREGELEARLLVVLCLMKGQAEKPPWVVPKTKAEGKG